MSDSTTIIVGIDEAGRGALAGPVVAAACMLPCPVFRRHHHFPLWSPARHPGRRGDCSIADSKRLSPVDREHAFSWITEHCPFGIGAVEAPDIDRLGILAATEKAMQEAVMRLAEVTQPTFLLVDGRDAFWFDYPHVSVIRGDETEPCIAAASIIAKVTRDRMMR